MSDIIQQLGSRRLLPLITLEQPASVLSLGRVLEDNGLPVAEITFRTPAAADAIALLRRHHPHMLIGAGTILNRQQALAAKTAGADFMVSPGFNPNTVTACRELDIPIIPGVNNASTIEAALEMGLTTLKFFPAEPSGGVAMLSALLGPFGQLSVLPTGGIDTNNLGDYLAIPQVLACGGSWLASPELIKAENWQEVARRVRQAVALSQ
ncbi:MULTISPECIES: bifunctional 4-hydroxy-2-oxoglutarate aldolase/2-dehydro-3-deoxy-phosphogluconate aldolase [Oceanimonas]|uniref:bifunctional 4-hydroxy-2-oxoglutarate aldolase/2-dehydro-3-deoxy-phosphogluconate aldolase n=1 Tax=Oceanimonas TaxID=129577 RepID=UPI00035FCE04|nr:MULTISPECIES: bifunctional 4-hydroxy-2-oxoglutarate aldolase/2-dehydro-3-deoxy-phosphogluconate aldolase [Oceanimonas]MDV2858452.1 bifunctional 4-hydroxy-2-oxoglutarate aldolase/2-dehydro-3-deoxy-phosphogluconate aldolase [Oceanimonas sp. CAM02]